MARSDRHLHLITLIAGLSVTALVLVAYGLNWLDGPEGRLYDFRAQQFQRFTPPPSDRIVHVDIDDAALDAIGAWPWPRTLMGELIDEMAAAGTKVIALDILYAEPQEKQWKPQLGTAGEADRSFRLIDHDANLAETFRKAKNVLVPVSLLFVSAHAQTPANQRTTALLTDDLELSLEKLTATLRTEGFQPRDLVEVEGIFFDLRRTAAQRRIERELSRGLAATPAASTRPNIISDNPASPATAPSTCAWPSDGRCSPVTIPR
jgi:hypothetical protein